MEGTTTGFHDHDEWSRQQLVDRVKELNGFVRKYAYRIQKADNDEDPTGVPPPLRDQVHQLHQTRGRLIQRIDVLDGVYRNTRDRLITALQGYEERKTQRREEMDNAYDDTFPSNQGERGQSDFDSEDEAFNEGNPDLDEDYHPGRAAVDDGF